MKTSLFLNYANVFMLASAALVFVTSCEKDDKDDKDPAFIGKWSRVETIPVEDFTIEVKEMVTFTASSFTHMGQVKNPETNVWIDLMGLKANISVDKNKMDVTVKEVGLSELDFEGMPTGDITYYSDEELEFEAILAEVEIEQTFNAEYSVSGDKLTLKSDDNSDGDFTDEGESEVYTRE
jgi:hypothetical protein